MSERARRTVEIETLGRASTALVAAGATLDGGLAAPGPRPARAPATCCDGLDPRGALFLGCALDAGRRASGCGPAVRWSSRRARTCRSTPTARRSTPPTSCTTALATGYARHPRRPRLRLVAGTGARPGRARWPRPCTTTPSTTRSTSWCPDRRLVGVMGGHALERGTDGYADAARLGRALAGPAHVVATGGGPGAMEAANLGALPGRADDDDALDEALTLLADGAGVPPVGRRAGSRAAFDVRAPVARRAPTRWASRPGSTATSRRTCSPPRSRSTSRTRSARTCCCTSAPAGIVFLPGRGGTVQEVFQDACENYYADGRAVAPMVLVGAALLDRGAAGLAAAAGAGRGRPMESHVHLVDSVDEAADLLAR